MDSLRQTNARVTDGDGRPDVCPNCGEDYDAVVRPDENAEGIKQHSMMCFVGTEDDKHPGWQFYHGVSE